MIQQSCWAALAAVLFFSSYTTDARVANGGKAVYADKLEGTTEQIAADLIKKFEGYTNKPYWDVNAWRAGYGSDTTTLANGQIVTIRPGMTVNKEDSERDLIRRIREFQSVAEGQAPNLKMLPEKTQAAILSVAYNYGSLPDRVVTAIQSGDENQIASAVESLKNHDGGVNAKRRKAEAAAIRE